MRKSPSWSFIANGDGIGYRFPKPGVPGSNPGEGVRLRPESRLLTPVSLQPYTECAANAWWRVPFPPEATFGLPFPTATPFAGPCLTPADNCRGLPLRQDLESDGRVRSDGTQDPHSRRRRMGVLPAVLVAVLLIGALIFIQRPEVEQERSRTEAVAVSETFIEAHNSRDHETARSMLADSALISMNPTFNVDDLEMGMAWLEATGWLFTSEGCTVTNRLSASPEEPVHVLCSLVHENAWSKAAGKEPDTGGALTLDVASGEIVTALLSSAPMSFSNDAVSTFENWLAGAHPDDLDIMYRQKDLPHLTSESIWLWGQYTDEFVESQRG